MANQPKKYKKFVATAATATLVASAIVPVASAAGFSDVAGNDHEVAINALVEAGIINGYADGTFKPNQSINRGQVVKLLGRWLEAQGQEIPADWETKERFTDLPVTAEAELVKYAALAKDAGVFAGSNGNLNHTQTMQRQQMAVVLVRAIKEISGVDLVADYKKAGFVTEISDLEAAFSAEQRNAIVALEYAGITNVSKFNPANSITRGQFASFLYRTINNVMEPEAGVSTVKAINSTTVEVTFDTEVDNVQALNFLISDLEVKNAAVKQTNKKVVVLTTAAQTADKEYTVSLGEDKIGTFKGIAAVVPTKVDLVEKSAQGKLGQQVTLKAQVTVAEGQSKAGIPVTFFIPGSANGVKAPVTVEAVTNDEGIATYTYTRYAATNDTVTVYANGDRSKFSTGYVFWAVDTTLTITEVTEGSTINNGSNKVYKVTYKDPETGKPVSGKTLNVSVKENIDVSVDKLQNVTINGTAVVQTSDSNTRAAQIKTDSKGEATFTVTGSNTEVTPVVFDAAAISTTTGNTTTYSQKYTADTLQAAANKVKFGALQAEYTIEVNRDGGEVAATGVQNGRKYKVVVKDKNGKLAANETVNVAFNEDIDGVISTTTEAKFVKVESDGTQKEYDYSTDKSSAKKITIKTNSKGEASFVIGNDKVNTYATPIVWIDINNHTGKDANLDKGEPNAIAPISYFQEAVIDGAKLVAKNGKDKEATEFEGEPANFEVVLVNQSGKEMKAHGYSLANTSYTIFNDGSNNIKVGNEEIAPNRSYHVTGNEKITVSQVDGKASSVKVTATGVAKKTENGVTKDFSFTSKEASAKFLNSNEITNPYTGVLDLTSIDKEEKEIKFAGKTKAVAYAGESGKTYKYYSGNSTIASANAFIDLLEEYKAAGKTVRATYEVKDDVVTFTIVSANDGSGSTTLVDSVNAAANAAQVKVALKANAKFAALSDADQNTVAANILATRNAAPYSGFFTETGLQTELDKEITAVAQVAFDAQIVKIKASTTFAGLVTAVTEVKGSEEAVTALNKVTTAQQPGVLAAVKADLKAKNVAELVSGIKTIIAAQEQLEADKEVIEALVAVNTAADVPAMEKALKDNASKLGVNISGLTTEQLTSAATYLHGKTGNFTKETFQAAFAIATDFVNPTLTSAAYDVTAGTITLTFSEAIDLSAAFDVKTDVVAEALDATVMTLGTAPTAEISKTNSKELVITLDKTDATVRVGDFIKSVVNVTDLKGNTVDTFTRVSIK